MNQPDILYLSSQTDNWEELLVVDLSKVGSFCNFLKEIGAEVPGDKARNPISIAIRGSGHNRQNLAQLKLYCED
mgnify:CR=1 FL=1